MVACAEAKVRIGSLRLLLLLALVEAGRGLSEVHRRLLHEHIANVLVSLPKLVVSLTFLTRGKEVTEDPCDNFVPCDALDQFLGPRLV